MKYPYYQEGLKTKEEAIEQTKLWLEEIRYVEDKGFKLPRSFHLYFTDSQWRTVSDGEPFHEHAKGEHIMEFIV